MKYLVDTSICIAAKRDPAVVKWLEANEKDLAISVWTLAELWHGVVKSESHGKKREHELFRKISEMAVLAFGRETAIHLAELFHRQEKRGVRMKMKDCIIAATALEHGLSLVTIDVGDFQHTGLKLVNPSRK